MSWVAIGLTGGMAVLGTVNAKQQQKVQKERNQIAADHNKYSNWTGKSMAQDFSAPTALQGGMQGAVAGLGMAQGMGSMFSKPKAPTGQSGMMVSDNLSQQNLYSNPYKGLA